MSDPQLLQTLGDIGLRDKEARVYLAALTLGPSTVLQISREARVKRSTAYSIIESLKQKSLIERGVFGVKELFTAVDPESLRLLLAERQAEFLNTLPKLSALHHRHNRRYELVNDYFARDNHQVSAKCCLFRM